MKAAWLPFCLLTWCLNSAVRMCSVSGAERHIWKSDGGNQAERKPEIVEGGLPWFP